MVAAGESRPLLWHRLHAEGVWLAVVDLDPAATSIEFMFVSTVAEGHPFVVGASDERRLAALLDERTEHARLVHVPGHHLAQIWPSDHHLLFHAGTSEVQVISAAEMTGLPGGPVMGARAS